MKFNMRGGIVGGLLGALCGVLIEKGISSKKAMQKRVEEAREANKSISEAVEAVHRATNMANDAMDTVEPYANAFKPKDPVTKVVDKIISVNGYSGETDADSVPEEPLPDEINNSEYMRAIVGTEDYYKYTKVRELIHEGKELDYLRFNKDSNEALMQYKAMKMADIRMGSTTFDILWRLFNIPYTHIDSPEDDTVRLNCIDDRKDFFGEDSDWNEEVTIADIVLYFAELMSADFDKSVDYFANELVANMGIQHAFPQRELEKRMNQFMAHDLYTASGFGMFGLDPVQAADSLNNWMSEYNHSKYFEEFDEEFEAREDELDDEYDDDLSWGPSDEEEYDYDE